MKEQMEEVFRGVYRNESRRRNKIKKYVRTHFESQVQTDRVFAVHVRLIIIIF